MLNETVESKARVFVSLSNIFFTYKLHNKHTTHPLLDEHCQSCKSLDFSSLVCLHMPSVASAHVGTSLISMQGKFLQRWRIFGEDEEK